MKKLLGICLLAVFAPVFACESDLPAGEDAGKEPPEVIGAIKNVAPEGLGAGFKMRYVPATGGEGFRRGEGEGAVALIGRGYWIGETEVTQELWRAVLGTNPSHNPNYIAAASVLRSASVPGAPPGEILFHKQPDPLAPGETPSLFPVDSVSWYDAIAFCNKLSALDGKKPVYKVSGVSNWKTLKYAQIGTPTDAWEAAEADGEADGYRLPTETEWLWAAMGADRGGEDVRENGWKKAFSGYAEGRQLKNYAWYVTVAGMRSHQTALTRANELGLYDMSGNVSEWCADREGEGASVRVLKGSHFDQGSYECAISGRRSVTEGTRDEYNGFRVILPSKS